MKKVFVILLFVLAVTGISSSAQAQIGIGRYERLQVMATDLEDATRQLYFMAEREAHPYSGRDNFALDQLRRLNQRAANFQYEIQRTDDPVALRAAYQRLISAYTDARYAMRGFRGRGSNFTGFEFRNVARLMNNLSRTYFNYLDRRDRGRDYDDFDDNREDHDYDDYEDHDDYEDYDD